MKQISERNLGGRTDFESASTPDEIERTVNWDSPKLELYETERCGTGVRAKSLIEKGESLGIFGGHILALENRKSLPPELEHFYFQVSDRFVLTHISLAQVRQSKIEFINHSCAPNAGFRGQIELVALREIQPAEAITFDYAICTSEPDFRMECFCQSQNCRRIITGEDWKITALQKKYEGYFQPYLERKIRA
jgi:hypothetical protein